MSGLSFESTTEDGSPREFAGMWRPPSVPQANGYVLCTCGDMLQTRQMMRDHWQWGHFDRPLFRDPAPERPKTLAEAGKDLSDALNERWRMIEAEYLRAAKRMNEIWERRNK